MPPTFKIFFLPSLRFEPRTFGSPSWCANHSANLFVSITTHVTKMAQLIKNFRQTKLTFFGKFTHSRKSDIKIARRWQVIYHSRSLTPFKSTKYNEANFVVQFLKVGGVYFFKNFSNNNLLSKIYLGFQKRDNA